MAKYYATTVVRLCVEAESKDEANDKIDLAAREITGIDDLLFYSEARIEPDKCSLYDRVNIKEKVKEVYAKLKCLCTEKSVNTYYDLLEAVLKL